MTDASKARAWRVKQNLTMEDLSRLTGFSTSAICRFEGGYNRQPGGELTPIPPQAWQRYRLVCAAVASGSDKFNWGE